jgi:hypothetical protein
MRAGLGTAGLNAVEPGAGAGSLDEPEPAEGKSPFTALRYLFIAASAY